MAPVALNVAPDLRHWRQAGITHLLLDAPLARTLAEVSSPAPAPDSAPASTPDSAPNPPPNLRINPEAGSGAKAWPAAWQSLWAQMSAAGKRPAAVWTYAELGTDLRGRADAGRRQTLRALLDELYLPKGSFAFWPYSLPPDNAPLPEMFLAGLNRFRPALVLLAGGQAAADLAMSGDRSGAGLGPMPSVNFQVMDCRGFRFILLPSLDEAGKTTGPARERLLEFIRAAIKT